MTFNIIINLYTQYIVFNLITQTLSLNLNNDDYISLLFVGQFELDINTLNQRSNVDMLRAMFIPIFIISNIQNLKSLSKILSRYMLWN